MKTPHARSTNLTRTGRRGGNSARVLLPSRSGLCALSLGPSALELQGGWRRLRKSDLKPGIKADVDC